MQLIKNFTFMKNYFCSLLAVVFISITSFAQESNFNKFFESSEFTQLSRQFSFALSDVDREMFGSINHDSNLYKIYRVSVFKNNEKNFITFFSNDNGRSFGLVYEKIDLLNSTALHFNEYGSLYAKFSVVQHNADYKFTIKEVYNPSTGQNPVNVQTGCIEKTYKILKKACESNDLCDMLCDLNPTCLPMLAIWATIYCITH